MFNEEVVDEHKSLEFAKQNNLLFFRVSARNDINVTQMFEKAGEEYLKKNKFKEFTEDEFHLNINKKSPNNCCSSDKKK